MALTKDQIKSYNEKKIAEFESKRKESEAIKKAISHLNGEIQKTQSYLQTAVSRFDNFRPVLMKQNNISQRLDLIERSVLMLTNQLDSLKPKIYMVDDPQYPHLKTLK